MFENQHSRYGAIARQIPFSFGRMLFVTNSSDAWSADSGYEYPVDRDGRVRHFTDISAVNDTIVTNQNDIVIIDGNTGFSDTDMLDISKNRVHFYGIEHFMGVDRHYGQRSRFSVTATATATNIATLKNTGVGNTFHSIKFSNASTVAEGLYCLAEGGEYSYYENCEFYKSTDLDEVGAAEILLNGDSCKFKNCTIGSLVNTVTANGARPCVLLNRETITGKVCRDSMFENCFFWRKAGDTDNRFIYGSGATDVERQLTFDDCLFNNTKLASQTMTLGAHVAAALTEGEIIFRGGKTVFKGVTDWATQTGIYLGVGAANAANGGEVIQAA